MVPLITLTIPFVDLFGKYFSKKKFLRPAFSCLRALARGSHTPKMRLYMRMRAVYRTVRIARTFLRW